MTRRRTAGWAALAAGLSASVAGVALLLQPGRPPADEGSVPVAAVASPSAPLVDAAPQPWAPPTRVTIGALKVDAPVDAVGVEPGGALVVPENPARLGWWIGSATPGSPRGTVVVAGHVDTAADGPGALFRLETLPLGATVQVRAGDRVVTYRTVARRSYAKERLPADLFAAGGAPRLALVTCGGTFHNGVYSHNVVVYAEPASA
ncbi:class F sortase [Symbioplanes lichenis]|uniref:class F sortase n=1 Tax=Symbioplanes lichenis TaxID=1629072 RepID=UPI002739EC49|nr:class F sortase [Actinoplanes lichenis]